MSTRHIYVTKALYQLSDADEDAWVKWLAAHQLDPNRVPVGSKIEADDEERTLTLQYIRLNEKRRAIYCDCNGGHLVTDTLVRRLEAKPLPFPAGMD